MKTALEQAIEVIRSMVSDKMKSGEKILFMDIEQILNSFIPTEKQQIVDAYEAGSENIKDVQDVGRFFSRWDALDQFTTSLDYFTQTFKND